MVGDKSFYMLFFTINLHKRATFIWFCVVRMSVYLIVGDMLFKSIFWFDFTSFGLLMFTSKVNETKQREREKERPTKSHAPNVGRLWHNRCVRINSIENWIKFVPTKFPLNFQISLRLKRADYFDDIFLINLSIYPANAADEPNIFHTHTRSEKLAILRATLLQWQQSKDRWDSDEKKNSNN